MSKRIVQQIVDVPVPQILEEIVALVAGEVVCNARTGVRLQHGWTCTCREADRGRSGTPQIQENIVEVIKVILREQCQRVLFFSFDSVWDSPLPHARVGVF